MSAAIVPGFARLKAVVNGQGHAFETCAVDDPIARAVSDELALPPTFQSLYEAGGPVERSSIPWVVEDLLLFAFSELPAAQAGYRWVGAIAHHRRHGLRTGSSWRRCSVIPS